MQVCISVSTSFNTADHGCGNTDTCKCGLDIRIWLCVQAAFLFLVTLSHIKAYGIVVKRFASRKLHKAVIRRLNYITVPCLGAFMLAGWLIFLNEMNNINCSNFSQKFRSLIVIDRVVLLI